ncbi:MAG: hypothetical protein ACOVQH_10205, partial [Burkholderiaceae bacterium]
MTTRIRKVITAIDTNGNAFSEQHAETLVGDKWFPLDPSPLVSGSAWATQYNAAIEAENARLKDDKSELNNALAIKISQLEATTQAKAQLDLTVATLTIEKQTLETEVAAANTTIATLQATIAALEATIVELTPPPKPASVTPAQIRLWLIAHGISLETVSQMIAAIPDEATRAAAQVRW